MMMMKRSPSSSSSSSSSSCVVDHFDALNQPIDEEKPRPKRVRRRNSSSKAIKSETNANGSENSNRRSSIYRGVTRHRWTGRFEAHLWDKSSWNTKQNKKGRQVYLGAYDSEADAARTYDLAALKYWGPDTTLNFPIENYKKEIEEMQNVSKEEYLASLRRQSSGFSRGVSKYRGVARHHHNGRWEARIGRVFGNKYLYLGTFSSQEEAAAAYDLAAIEYRGPNAVTNFDISNYIGRVKSFIPTQPKPTPTSPEAPQHGCLTEHDPLPPLPPQGTESGPFDEPHLINDDPPMLAVAEEETDHDPWSFCLDSGGGYGQFMVPEVPFMVEEDGRFFDLIDQTGFEDDIDLIFDGEMNVHVGDHGVVNGGCGVVGAEEKAVIEVAEEEGQLLSSSSPVSSSSSTTTLVSVACQL